MILLKRHRLQILVRLIVCRRKWPSFQTECTRRNSYHKQQRAQSELQETLN